MLLLLWPGARASRAHSGHIGARITGGTFTRGRWREIVNAKLAKERAAQERRERKRRKEQQERERAARIAAQVAADEARILAAEAARQKQIAELLALANQASGFTGSIHDRELAMARAIAMQTQANADREEEELMALFLDDAA